MGAHVRARRVAVAGHFGELMQGRLGADGPVALISLPCPALTMTASAYPRAKMALHSAGTAPILSPARAKAFLARLGLTLPARVVLRATMPVGGGAGASTAALVALARLAGWRGPDLDLARACIASEGASDPLILPRPAQTLWASRHGHVLAHLPPLPAFDILGGFWGEPRRTDARDLHFPDISALLPDWIAAAQAQDLDMLAQLATRSAHMTLSLRGAAPGPLAELARALGAKGVVIAHTGSARGLIFARGAVPPHGRAALRAAGLSQPLVFRYQGA